MSTFSVSMQKAYIEGKEAQSGEVNPYSIEDFNNHFAWNHGHNIHSLNEVIGIKYESVILKEE